MTRVSMILAAACFCLCTGCAPATVAMKVGMFAFGKIVSDAESDKLHKELIGKEASAADAVLGEKRETWAQVGGSSRWVEYGSKLDPLGRHSYFVEVRDGKIARVEKMSGALNELDLARSTLSKARVHGKSPAECEKVLEAGPPSLTVRGSSSGKTLRFHDGEVIPELGPRKFILLTFDAQDKCEKLQIVEVSAEAG